MNKLSDVDAFLDAYKGLVEKYRLMFDGFDANLVDYAGTDIEGHISYMKSTYVPTPKIDVQSKLRDIVELDPYDDTSLGYAKMYAREALELLEHE